MAGLPAPVTTTDQLLTAVHTELVGLRADLASSRGGETAAPLDSTSGTVELIEPKPASKTRRTPTHGGS